MKDCIKESMNHFKTLFWLFKLIQSAMYSVHILPKNEVYFMQYKSKIHEVSDFC